MRIEIHTIPHNEQRYNTCGDWYWRDGILYIKISRLEHSDPEYALIIHELVEALACHRAGITPEQVDKFDTDLNREDEAGELEIEMGDHPDAPYKREHSLATGIERQLCAYFNIDWFSYENELTKLQENYKCRTAKT